jgi:hypothetical protein
LIERRGRPGLIVSDHGTELTSNAILAWCAEQRIEWHYIAPGKPMQTDVIDKGFLRGAALFCFGARATARRRAGREGKALPRSLHCRTSVAAPVRSFFGPRGFHPATKRV